MESNLLIKYPIIEKLQKIGVFEKIPNLSENLKNANFEFLNEKSFYDLEASSLLNIIKGLFILMNKLLEKAKKDFQDLKEEEKFKNEVVEDDNINENNEKSKKKKKNEEKVEGEEKKKDFQIEKIIHSSKGAFEEMYSLNKIEFDSLSEIKKKEDILMLTDNKNENEINENKNKVNSVLKDINHNDTSINNTNKKNKSEYKTNEKSEKRNSSIYDNQDTFLKKEINTFNNFLDLDAFRDINDIRELNNNFIEGEDNVNQYYNIENNIDNSNVNQQSNEKNRIRTRLSVSTNLFHDRNNQEKEIKPTSVFKRTKLFDKNYVTIQEKEEKDEIENEEYDLASASTIDVSTLNQNISNFRNDMKKKITDSSFISKFEFDVKQSEAGLNNSFTNLHNTFNFNNTYMQSRACHPNLSLIETFILNKDEKSLFGIGRNKDSEIENQSGIDSAIKMERFRHDSTNKKSFEKIGNISFGQLFDIKNNVSFQLEEKILEEDTAQVNPTTYINRIENDFDQYNNDNIENLQLPNYDENQEFQKEINENQISIKEFLNKFNVKKKKNTTFTDLVSEYTQSNNNDESKLNEKENKVKIVILFSELLKTDYDISQKEIFGSVFIK